MADKSPYSHGVPVWVDVASPDLEASKAFYGSLFGWQAETAPDPEAGGYTLFHLDGKQVAGLMALNGPDQPPAWLSYIATDKADDTITKVTSAGGKVVMPPMDVMDQGRVAVLSDVSGAVFGVWQAGTFRGAEVFNTPNAFCWSELAVRDIDPAKAFYSAVFGWDSHTSTTPSVTYTEWKLQDRTIGGMIQMDSRWPAGVPAHWTVYFTVEDCDAALNKVKDLGGEIQVPPMDIDAGRFAAVSDPQGAHFSIIQMKPQA